MVDSSKNSGVRSRWVTHTARKGWSGSRSGLLSSVRQRFIFEDKVIRRTACRAGSLASIKQACCLKKQLFLLPARVLSHLGESARFYKKRPWDFCLGVHAHARVPPHNAHKTQRLKLEMTRLYSHSHKHERRHLMALSKLPMISAVKSLLRL